MRTIICTGITGSDQIGCLEATKAYAQGHGQDLRIIKTWDVAKEVSEEPIDEGTILNLPESYRQQLFGEAYLEISRRLDEVRRKEKPQSEQFVALMSHTTFFWKSTYLEAFPGEVLASLRPDLFVTIINNIKDIKRDLDNDPFSRFTDITLADILHWRDRETTNTSAWARNLGKKHFIIAHDEPPETLYGVIFRPEAKRIYASYPMSYVSRNQKTAASKLVSELRRMGFIVFNPGSIDDAGYVDQLAEQRMRDEYVASAPAEKQLHSLVKAVGDQTVKLDYLLIDQSDLVVVYYPSVAFEKYLRESDKVVTSMYVPLSAGVICEIVHGHRGGKKVCAVWLPKDAPSPFFRYHCEQVFNSKKKLLEYLGRRYHP